MLTGGIVLLILDVLMDLGAFAFAAKNMAGGVRRPFDDHEGMFSRHLGAMVVMAIGGSVGLVGVILIVLHILGKAGLL
jgi:hypothetical protein